MTLGDVPVTVTIRVPGWQRIENKLNGFPKATLNEIEKGLKTYFYQDYKPMLNKVLKGFRGRGVPTKNAPRWARIKASVYGINHSLGILTEQLHTGAMAVKPKITRARNRTILKADYGDIPKSGYPYLVVVHEGKDRLSQPYPMVEAAQLMTHRRLLKRLDNSVSDAWNKSGG